MFMPTVSIRPGTPGWVWRVFDQHIMLKFHLLSPTSPPSKPSKDSDVHPDTKAIAATIPVDLYIADSDGSTIQAHFTLGKTTF